MIECQICKVTNDERALFCVECGQRLKQTQPTGIDISQDATKDELANPTQDRSLRPSVKLHSPILDGKGSYQEDTLLPNISRRTREDKSNSNTESSSQSSKPHGSVFNSPSDESKANHLSKARPALRSPLLGAPSPDTPFDEAEAEASASNQETSRGGGLRSPLLRGGTYSNDDHEPQRNIYPHRQTSEPQNIEPSSNNSELRSQPQKLKSPLLGAAESQEPTFKASGAAAQDNRIKTTGRPGRLHSPVLHGASSFSGEDEVFEEEKIDDNPNILRSPLLSAKLPLADKQATQTHNTPATPIEDKGQFQLNMEQTLEVKPAVTPAVPERLPPQAESGFLPPPMEQLPRAGRQLLPPVESYKPEPLQQAELPQAPYSSALANNSLTYSELSDKATTSSWAPEPTGGVLRIDEKKEVPIPSQPRPTLDPKDITPVHVPALGKVAIKQGAPSSPESQDIKLLRSGTVAQPRILPRRFNDVDASEPRQSFTRAPEGENTKAKFVMVALVIAIICKLWYLAAVGSQAWSSPPFLFDQFGQIAVMVCLIIVALHMSSARKSS